MVDGLCKVPQEIIPETFLELAKVLNRNFLVQVNDALNPKAWISQGSQPKLLGPGQRHPTPYTLHPTPYTLHPTP
jgi:hypothetical protein